ncbi:right-handed parallel beta-helix repeat-containing protein [Mesorhizobium huakuii]|uniref:right-handed parallel beta-helix repeat-containing protein n=1 Tax=Mesorhizobium huakuii TaxID=28104 RepID=UPI0024E0AFA4|nr:right-handed parallel beta-helix repeat-containing protein [Mesorhizobium huakuii]
MRAVYRRSRIVSHLWKTTALTTLALGLSGVVAHADPDGLWQPQIRAIVGADNNGGNAALEGFIPIKQTAESVLFLDVRAKHDFKDASGQDIGLGIRRIVNPDLMLGGYAYINLENYNSTQFTAATLGVEAITPNFDAHVNVFVPIKGDSTDHSTGSTLSMVGNQLIEQISVLDHRDYAAWGIEGEIGAKVPVNLPDKHSLRLDIGGYHFEDPHGDDGSVTGAKAGFEYTIGDVFGSGTELVFAGEVRNDNRDDTQFAGSVRLNIPFNPGHNSDKTAAIGTDPVYPVSEGLRKRVNERVRGDIGVRVQSQETDGGSTTRVAINAATNAAFGKFYYADGGLAGAGTQADPTTLDDAVTKAGSGGFVVALGGNGNLTTAGVTLANGQTVIGGGESVTAKLSGGGTATFNLGGSDGTIQGTNVANNVIALGTGNTLNGITITGGANGIFGNGVAGTTLTNFTVTGTGANGILGNNLTNTTLTNVTVTSAGGNGAEFTGSSTNVKASNFTATGNGLDGLHIEDNGTYNFTGTTLLQGNHDDGLDITGQGTYTFATVNALDNTDRGITVQGTSSGGSFTTTGGTVSGNGGVAVFIDPITAHVVLDSISQTGGTSGVVLDHVSGSFIVNGAATISNTTGPAIAISASPATIRFGDINITNPGAGGMSFSGVNAAVVAGNIVISGLGVGSGLDFSGSQTNFAAQSLNITGPGAAGTIGIDLADTTGGTIVVTNGGSISGVDTGVRLGISGSLAHSANAEFTFGGGSIAGNTASLDARGLNQTLGHYAFGSTTFSGLQLFDQQNVIFVGSTATGLADGSSLSDLASFTTANAITDSDAIFVLVNDGTPINASGGFSLSDGQTLASFGNGRSFSLGGIPVNVTGDNIQHDQIVSDPGGGAATLTNSGAGDVVTAANGNSLLDFNISGGSAAGINASAIDGLTIQGVTVSNVAVGLVLDGVTGTITVADLNVQNTSQTGIALVHSSATVNFTGNTTIGNATNVGLFANNFDGTATFDDLDITGGGIGVGIVAGSSGTLTFGAGSSIAGTSSNAFSITNSTPNVTYNGTISQTSAASAVKISNMTGGTATFGGKITASTGAANAIDLTGNAGGKINFTGGLDLTADGGFAFSAVGGGTLTVTGSGNTVATGLGPDEKGIQIAGMTIGAAGVNFSSVTVDGSGGGVSTGIAISNTSGGNVTFGGVDLYRISGIAISLNNVTSGTYSFSGTTKVDTVVGGVPGLLVQNSAATVNVGNLVSTNIAGADVSLANNTGTIGIGGTITNSGTGDGVVVSGGSAAITVSAAISSSAGAPGTAVKVDGITGGSVAFSGPINSTGTGTGVSVSNTAAGSSVGFGAVTVSGASGNGIDISGNAGSVTFTGTSNITLGSAANAAGINFSGTNANVLFGTTNVTMGAGANQTGIDFSGSATTADFGVTSITGTGDLTSRGIDLSSTTGNKTITFLRGSSITNLGIGVDLSSGGTTATSANANFTFGDGISADGLQSSISATAVGAYTVNTIGLDPTLGNYNFNDVFFTGSAHLASAVGGVTMVSQNGGVIAAGTDGLSAAVTTISLAQADAMLGTQTFAFVGTVDLGGTPFTLDSGQSITGFGNNTSITVSGTIQPVNVQGNLGATGGNVTGNEGVVTGTGDFLHLLGSNQVRNTAFDFSGASGSVFTVDQSAGGFNNAGGIVIEGVTVSNVAAGSTAFKVAGLDSNLSITNNNINVAGTLLDVNGGTGNITVTRGTLPNSGPAGTLTGGGISIANRTGGLVNFTDKVTVGGNGVSLTGNTGSTVTFADLDITTNGVTAFAATGGGTVNVVTGTINATSAQAVALDGITAGTTPGVDGIHFASTSATFSSGNGIDLQNLSGTASFGTGTLTNTGPGTAFNVGSATNASGGNAIISYGGTIASNGTGAAVSIQELTGGSVTLSGNLTDGLADAGGNIVVTGIDNGTAATVTFSGSTKQIDSGATDGVSLGIAGNYPLGAPAPNTNGTVNFSNGGLAIKTTTGTGFVAAYGGTVSVSGTGPVTGNTIDSGSNGLVIIFADVGSAGVTFDSVKADSAIPAFVGDPGGAGVTLSGSNLAGDVNIGGLRDTGYTGASLSALSGTGVVNFTGTIDLDVSYAGFNIGGPQVGTVNIANVAGSTLTIDGGQYGIIQTSQGGTVNVGVNGSASITNTTLAAFSLGGGNDLAFTTLTYKGSVTIGAGSVISASGDGTRLNMSGSVNSTTSSTAFDFFGHADGIYNISSSIDHSGGKGVAIGGSANGTVTFSGTSKKFNTGANDAIVKAPAYVPDPQTKGTLNFTNGGLVITTTSGAGFTASTFGPGTISVTGAGNTITTGTGTALKLGDATAVLAGATGATIGVDGIKFDTISTNGATTGISLNDVSGGALDLGAVNLLGITGANARGVDISGTLGSTVSFDSLNMVIAAGATNAVSLDLNGASLGASNITAGDFDVDGGGAVGSIGIDMAGTTGTGTIQLGDTVNNNLTGQTSTIANVGYGVQFSSATNAKLVFGDGQGPAESSIKTTGGQVIHATDTLPTSGDYNFNDVNFTGDTANLSSISVYYVTSGGTGDGSLANPGSYVGAQASTANVVVLIDKNIDGSQETIDLSGTSYQLHDGQVLLAFKSGDAAVDVSQLGVDASGGASAAFHFTTIQNSPIVSAPAGIDTLRPVLQSNNATSVINFATSGTSIFTGGLENLIVTNVGSGAGVAVDATGASSFFLRNNTITAGGNALDFSTTGAPADTLLLSIDGNTLRSTASGLAASFSGQNISTTDNSIAIRSFAGNKVTGGAGSGGIVFNNVRFDSDGAGGTVSAGTLGMGTPGTRVQSNGLSFINTSGTLDLGTLSLANNGGTGVLVNTKGAGTIFTLNNSAGVVTTLNGAAFDLDPLTVNMTFSSVSAVGGASGIIFDGVAGTFTVTGTTSISNTTGFGIDAINTNTGTFNFNTVTVNNVTVPNTGGGIHVATGTLNVTGLANIDTTSGTGLSQGGGTTSFTGGLTIDTTTGTGIAGTGGTMGITDTGGAETVNSAGGTAIKLSGVAATIALDSTSSGGGTNNISLTSVTGTIGLGTGTMTGATGTSFEVVGGTATVIYAGNITQANNAALVGVSSGNAGTLTFNTGTLSATNGTGLQFDNADGNYNFNGITTLNGGDAGIDILNGSGGTFSFGIGTSITSPSGTAFNVVGGTAAVTYSGSITQANNAALVAITGHTSGTITFQTGTLSATNGTGLQFNNADGTYNFIGTTTLNGGDAGVDIINGSGGTFSFGTGTSITNPSGIGFNVVGGTANVAYAGTINKTVAGKIVDISGVAAGSITLSGNLSATGGVDNGIFVHGNTGGTFIFGGATETLTTGTFTAVDLVANTNATITFGAGSLAINTSTGIGFNATGGGTVNVTGSGNTVQTAGGQILNWNGMTVGGSGATFASLQSTGSITGLDAINLTGVSGGTFNGGAVSVAGTTTSGDGIEINGSSAAFNFTSATIAATADNGIFLSGANGAVTFSTVAINNTGQAGIRIDNNTNAVAVNGGSIGATNDPTGNGVDINGGTGNVTIAASVTKTSAGNIVNVSGRTAGTVAFSGSLSATGSFANGIDVSGNSGTAVINFSNATKTLTTGANTAVNLTSNTGATINFTGGGLAINTTSGTGFNATGGGTVTVQGTGNAIVSTSGSTALNISNTLIGSGNATFQSITSNGGSANGIILVNTGTGAGNGGLHVTGTGSAGTGGTIANKTGADGSTTQGTGIFLNGTKDVQLAWMQLNDFSNFAIRGNNVTGFTLDHSVISGDSGTSNSLSDGLAAFANVGEDAIRLTNLLGSGSITNSNISGGYTNTVNVENNTGTLNRLTIDSSTIGGRSDNGTGMNDGIHFQADAGSTAMNLTVSNSVLTTARANLVAATGGVGTNMDVQLTGNTVTNNHPLTVSGGTAFDIASLGNVTFNISNNTFDMHAANGGTGIKSHVIEVNKATGSGNSTFDGTISGNTIGVAATAHSGSGIGSNDIDINSQDNGTFTIAILNNILTHYDTAGIQISQISGSSTINATVQGNTTSNGDSNAFTGLYVVAGSGLAGDNGVINLLVGGSGTQRNDFSNGDPANGSDVFLAVSGGASTSTINLSRGVSAAGTASQVVLDNNLNPGATAVATSGTINLVNTVPPLP